jgi:lipooligosaccharide transport system ATP-binding protein
MDAPLTVQDLRKTYAQVPVVDELSFALEKGQCFGLLGPNGAGKTTTLKLCLGLTAPDAGHITLAGLPIPAAAKAARMRVGVVPQLDNLDPDFTVSENLFVFGRYFGLSRADIEPRLDWLLQFSSLENKRDARINTLSGGMKRRLTLARALVNDPDILFLDEPTTGLDPQARRLIWDRLNTLKNAGKSLLLTTHFMDEAERLCDQLIILDNGKKIAAGSPRELIARHIEPQVIEVLADADTTLTSQCTTQHGIRMEKNGESTFFYGEDVQPLLGILDSRGLHYLHRAANLEDVFIHLTGRELRD